MDVNSAKDKILNLMEESLADNLYYHGKHHTLDVANVVLDLCETENITGRDKELLVTAAYFHDSGFINTYANHEEESCALAKKYLPEFGFSKHDLAKVCEMIMATKIPQRPTNKLEEIICDADLDYLGRPDFFDIGNSLFKEFQEHNIIKDEKEWNRLQVKFLESQQYFTNSSINKRTSKKAEHLAEIKRIINQY
ncbi:MAG: hypothetical protein ACJAZ3_001694 [Sphingobacteriales bacterium]|jgi:uncharacterized protein